MRLAAADALVVGRLPGAHTASSDGRGHGLTCLPAAAASALACVCVCVCVCVRAFVFDADNTTLCSGARDTSVRVWDIAAAKQTYQAQRPRNLVGIRLLQLCGCLRRCSVVLQGCSLLLLLLLMVPRAGDSCWCLVLVTHAGASCWCLVLVSRRR